ncbi:hypothetical protein GCM10010910_03890 [Microbacterium nanhaiense]|uniref:Type ISP restriction-modification enzyme LLaBIII C-terminal specificity domain-containing protein n=1 Tax=Microbacterium nanhaiense TaxID=1301026 RepID=A0ABQ2MWZ1_9MICO|nr:hypothetical protein GCM10010910_03890 [Microbacterium nanhaiense]
MTPNAEGDWINQRDPNYEKYPPMSSKTAGMSIFSSGGMGIATSRDSWVYSPSTAQLGATVAKLVGGYNSALEGWVSQGAPEPASDFLPNDPKIINWSAGLRKRLLARRALADADFGASLALYRPFNKVWVTRNLELIERPAAIDRYFKGSHEGQLGIYQVGSGSAVPFSVIVTNAIPDLHVTGAGSGGQFFARYSYTHLDSNSLFDQPERVDNITDWALDQYRDVYGPQVTKDDIFFYVYGLLHSTEYRERYAADLKKQLPRIPMVSGRERFEAFVTAGRTLSELHIGYEDIEPHQLTEVVSIAAPTDEYERFSVKKMKYGGKAGAWDKTRIRYNDFIDIEGIPVEAQEYMLGSRSGLDWIIERYQVKTDKASGIVNDPNDWSREHEQSRYIIDLIGRITALSLKTMEIVNGLPTLEID